MLDVRLFGKFEVSQDGRPVEIASRPVHSLLAYLILNAGVMVRREKVAGLLWPDSEEDNARHNLRQALWRLGKVIGKEYLLTDKVSVSFDSRADFTLDVATLLEEVTEEGTADQLIRSVSVYTDVLLPGFYDDWVLLEQDRLQAIYENRMQLLLERLATEERWRENREWAEMWIAQGRVPEAAYRALMTALAALGDRAGVSAVYQRCIEALKAEVGVEPSAETQDLYQRISSGKNLTELQEPPTRERITVRLPIQPTPFIGRKNDLKELSALLSDPNIRLINVQGLGGIGKTRLAIETAGSQRDSFADGVFFVPLAALDDPNLIETSIRSVIQISSQAQNQLGRNHQYKQLLYYLRDKKLLLVLDNLEHLLDGLSIISDILRSAPGVKIFTTSRQRLNLRGETVYTLDSMPVPVKTSEVAALMGQTNDAIQLFMNSARLAQPKFELTADNLNAVIRVCRLVDGLPLGIELAGNWAGMLTPDEIAAEIKNNLDFLSTNLQNMPDRQQSIRSVFESSWNRLTNIEQTVFQRMSVFRGGFTRQAAEDITGATVQVLMGLVNKSLVQPDYTGRYHLHELLKQYGREKLLEAGEMAETRDRHLAFFLELAEETAANLVGSDAVMWSNQAELEHDNLRAALSWGLAENGQAVSGLRFAGSFVRFWSLRGYYDEGRDYLSRALSKSEAQKRTALRAKALHAAGHLAHMQSDYRAARPLLEESRSIYEELGPAGRLGRAEVLITQGDMELESGEFQVASSMLNEALDMMRELKNIRGIAHALWQLGTYANSSRDPETAVQYYEEALPLLHQIGDMWHLAVAFSGLASVMIRLGNYERAAELEQESLRMRREAGDPFGIAVSLGNFAWMGMKQDDSRKALDFLRESLALRSEIGDIGGVSWCLEKLAEIAFTTGQQKSSPDEKEMEFRRAARLFGGAWALRASVDSKIDLVDQPEHEEQVMLVRRELGETIFAADWEKGQTMTLQQAVAYALVDRGTGE